MSGYCDSNTGPSGPKPDALANCATPRLFFIWDCKYRAFFYNHQIFPNIFSFFLKTTLSYMATEHAYTPASRSDRTPQQCSKPDLPSLCLSVRKPPVFTDDSQQNSSSSAYEAVNGRQCNQAEFCAEPRLFGYGRRSSRLQKQKTYSEKHKYLIYRQKDTLKFEPLMIG